MSISGRLLLVFAALAGFWLSKAEPGCASEPAKESAPVQQSTNSDGIGAMPEALTRQLIKLEPKLDLSPPPVQASQPSPQGKPTLLTVGIEEKNLAIEWDDWHNKVSNAVLPRIFSNPIESLNVPEGARTWVHFQVTNDRRITSVQVLKSSGNLQYDRLVRDAVYKLDGSYVLSFPAGSKRTDVDTNVAFRKGGGQKNYVVFGDVEYSEMDSQDAQQTPGAAGSSAPQAADSNSEQSKKRHRIW
jgi:hypothetical protein